MISLKEIIIIVEKEINLVQSEFPPYRSRHEGYAVVLEELDEAWDEIKLNDAIQSTREMVQVAATAIRWLNDCGDVNELKRLLK